MGRPSISDEQKKANRREYMRKYWQEHKKDRNEATKRWRHNHPENARKLNRDNMTKYRNENREKYNAYQREYRRKRKALLDIVEEDMIY